MPSLTGNKSALEFDGIDDAVALPDMGEKQQVSICFWIQGDGNQSNIIGSDPTVARQTTFNLLRTARRLQIKRNNYLWMFKDVDFEDNEWTFIVVTADVQAKQFNVFANGKRCESLFGELVNRVFEPGSSVHPAAWKPISLPHQISGKQPFKGM
ncbi:MAG: hypothetical protein CMJ78_23550 [Planctomycetaceae bacterium]|nr:hypothetical protein [Planctomycetaceae bacterium]